jgi:four helix bundle protein
MRNFEEILSRQRSQELTLKFYKIFKDIRDFSFRDQLQKAAVSISNNIAEWFERKSNNEFRYFLYVAKWSSGEVRSMLYLAKKLNYITEEKFNEFYDETKKISELIHWLIRSLK